MSGILSLTLLDRYFSRSIANRCHHHELSASASGAMVCHGCLIFYGTYNYKSLSIWCNRFGYKPGWPSDALKFVVVLMFMSVHRLRSRSECIRMMPLPQPLSAKEMMVESDGWSLAEVRCHPVAVEPHRNHLEHMHRYAKNQFQGPKIKTTLARATPFSPNLSIKRR